MSVCLSGSMALIDRIEELSLQLDALGHQSFVPSRGDEPHIALQIEGLSPQQAKSVFVADHLGKIQASDALLVANFAKDGVEGYLGLSALMEAAMAYALGKKIYVLNKSNNMELAEGLSALGVVELNGCLDAFA